MPIPGNNPPIMAMVAPNRATCAKVSPNRAMPFHTVMHPNGPAMQASINAASSAFRKNRSKSI